jgi:hypothetical protein
MRNPVEVLLYVLRGLLSVALGVFGGWWLMVGFCSGVLFGHTVMCGHNAVIPLLLLAPVAGFLGWFALAPVTWRAKRGRLASARKDGA